MRMVIRSALLSFIVTAPNLQAAEFAACVVDSALPDNPVYYYLPTTGTKLRCEINRANYSPTLRDLYADGWRLITVVDPKVRKQPSEVGAVGGDRPSPVLYLEREGGPMASADSASAPAEEGSGEQKSGGGLFGLF